MVGDAASEALNARAIGMRVLDGVVGGIADGQALQPLTPDDDHRLARRLRVLAENLRLTRAEAYDPTTISYPLWPEPASEPVWLTDTEVDALLAAPDRGTWNGQRDHALLLLAVQTGLRISELITLTRVDVHLGAGACAAWARDARNAPPRSPH